MLSLTKHSWFIFTSFWQIANYSFWQNDQINNLFWQTDKLEMFWQTDNLNTNIQFGRMTTYIFGTMTGYKYCYFWHNAGASSLTKRPTFQDRSTAGALLQPDVKEGA